MFLYPRVKNKNGRVVCRYIRGNTSIIVPYKARTIRAVLDALCKHTVAIIPRNGQIKIVEMTCFKNRFYITMGTDDGVPNN
jgi:hypothetical protein